MKLVLRQHRILINLALFILISLGLLILLPSVVLASDEVIKAEMYLGDYEISKEKTSSGSYINKEVKYIETGSGKVIKERISTTNTWNTKYYHTNHQGSTSVVTNNQGQKDTEFSTGRLRYFPYGEQITRQDINNLVVDDTYTGQKRDTETDLMFYNARLYNQKTGLFMQADLMDDGPNRYMYVAGCPINNSDPSGHFCIPCVIGIVAIAGWLMTGGVDRDSSAPVVNDYEPSEAQRYLNMAFAKATPVGPIISAAELYNDRDLVSGGNLGRADKLFNVLDVLSLGLTSVDNILGTINRSHQIQVVSRMEGGRELLAAKSMDQAEAVLQNVKPHYYEVNEFIQTNGLFYNSEFPVIQVRRSGDLSTLQHEGVHLLQSVNKHPYLDDVSSLRNHFNFEFTAWGITGVGPIDSITGQILGATSSTFKSNSALLAIGAPTFVLPMALKYSPKLTRLASTVHSGMRAE